MLWMEVYEHDVAWIDEQGLGVMLSRHSLALVLKNYTQQQQTFNSNSKVL